MTDNLIIGFMIGMLLISITVILATMAHKIYLRGVNRGIEEVGNNLRLMHLSVDILINKGSSMT